MCLMNNLNNTTKKMKNNGMGGEEEELRVDDEGVCDIEGQIYERLRGVDDDIDILLYCLWKSPTFGS